MKFFTFGSKDIGIDLGTANILVTLKGRGIILKEPSVVAIDRRTGNIMATGNEAKEMLGRTPDQIKAVRPLKDGVISDYDITEKMLKEFIKKACGGKKIIAPKVMVCIPSQATEVEKRAVIDATKNSGAKEVHLIEEPLSAAIGAGIDITKPDGNMIVDIGGGTTDIAVISLGGVVIRKSIKSAGDRFDEAIVKYVRLKHRIMIGEKTAEDLKINIGCVYKDARESSYIMKGRNLVTGLPDQVEITSEEIREALEEPVGLIVDGVKSILEKTPPELASDIIEKGIIMTGGGSLLYGLDKLIEVNTGLNVKIAENSVEAVVEGTGQVLNYINKLQFDDSGNEISLIE